MKTTNRIKAVLAKNDCQTNGWQMKRVVQGILFLDGFATKSPPENLLETQKH